LVWIGPTGVTLLRCSFAVPICQNRLREFLIESLVGAQEARHEEVEQTPKLQNVVLNGRSGQKKTMIGFNHLYSLRELRLGVLDDVAFVQDAVEEVDVFEGLDIVSYGLVRSDDNVVILELGKDRAALTRAARVENRSKMITELSNLVVPVACERGRTHDERRDMRTVHRAGGLELLRALVVFAGKNADGLQTLAEAHVCMSDASPESRTIAKDTMKLVARQECEPADTLLLVIAQLSLDWNGNFVLFRFAAVQQLG
jgi:hypothetical protein